MRLPSPRGPISEAVVTALTEGPDAADLTADVPPGALADDDVQLSLWLLYALHYGLEGVDPALEWDPDLIRLRRRLEDRVLAELREATAPVVAGARGDDPLPERLFTMIDSFEGPSVARFVQRRASAEQVAELLAHRSVYNLRETDPQLFAMPRLPGRAQVALAELAYDEYGGGRPERLHSLLYARAMAACDLDTEPGGYVDVVPGTTLAVVNVMHLFALRRELVAATAGHFGAFEATSSVPSRQISAGAERLGMPEDVRAYYDEHVEADAVHEQLAIREMCTAVVEDDSAAEELVLLGAASCLVVEAAAGAVLLEAWEAGRSSLLDRAAEDRAAS